MEQPGRNWTKPSEIWLYLAIPEALGTEGASKTDEFSEKLHPNISIPDFGPLNRAAGLLQAVLAVQSVVDHQLTCT